MLGILHSSSYPMNCPGNQCLFSTTYSLTNDLLASEAYLREDLIRFRNQDQIGDYKMKLFSGHSYRAISNRRTNLKEKL